MIQLSNVSYSYPGAARPTIQQLSLQIEEGEFVVVCGPSGAGKSTLLRLLNGLVPHFYGGTFSGEVRLWNRSTLEHQPRDLTDLVGFVFQNPEAQFVVDLVEDELVFAMENLGVAPPVMRRRVEEVLDQLGIAHLRRRRVSTLSGGEQQRVAIAAVLAAQPRALVLDEPTSQLDPHAAEEVLSALQKLNDDLGLTIVLCEHRLERVVQYADRVLYVGGPEAAGTRQRATNQHRPNSPMLQRENHNQASLTQPLIGPAREVLAQIELAPPLVQLGRKLGWQPLPLTIKQGRECVRTTLPVPTPPHVPKTELHSHAAPAIEVRQLDVEYGAHEALFDVSLAAYPGEVLALMGRNGSGKTTLLKTLVGLNRAQRGQVRVLGQDVARLQAEQLAGMIGYVPQDPRSILFHDTVLEELAWTLGRAEPQNRRTAEPRTTKPQNWNSAVEATLELLGIGHLAGAYPRDLSGGEAQRAALGAVLVAEPPILLLDEPTRGLDYAAKAALSRLLRQLAAAGRTIILATHDVEMVAACADRVALLGDGELVVEGPVREILSDSLTFSPQIAKLFPGTGWLTVEDVPVP